MQSIFKRLPVKTNLCLHLVNLLLVEKLAIPHKSLNKIKVFASRSERGSWFSYIVNEKMILDSGERAEGTGVRSEVTEETLGREVGKIM